MGTRTRGFAELVFLFFFLRGSIASSQNISLKIKSHFFFYFLFFVGKKLIIGSVIAWKD